MHQAKFTRDKYITFNKNKKKHCCQLNSITTVIIKVIFNCRNTVHANATCTCRHKFKYSTTLLQHFLIKPDIGSLNTLPVNICVLL